MNCDSCGKNTVPAYHLAMSDTSIRNFCTLPCVMVFQVMGFADCKGWVVLYQKIIRRVCQVMLDIKSVPDMNDRTPRRGEKLAVIDFLSLSRPLSVSLPHTTELGVLIILTGRHGQHIALFRG